MKKVTLLLIFLLSCRKEQDKIQIFKGFYWWKQSFNMPYNGNERKAVESLNKLYVRFFDVSWNEVQGVVPLGIVLLHDFQLKYFLIEKPSVEIIPTIFITNYTFENLAENEIPDFVEKVSTKINDLLKFNYYDKDYQHIFTKFPIKEVQFDCDWTAKTQSKYFEFLKQFRQRNPTLKLSATIRLYQFKYFEKTGIPPVQKGTLMCYNLNTFRNPEIANSILSISELKKYLNGSKPYPLKLDIALPLFSWGLVFRENQYKEIFRDLDDSEAKKLSFLIPVSNNYFRCNQDTVFYDFFLREGDLIKIEEVEKQTLLEAVSLLRPIVNNDSLTVSFFHLDDKILRKYDSTTIKAIRDSFR